MAYSAIEKMRKKNEQIYGMDVGPMQPALSDGAEAGFDLKSAALRFLHERCEGLLFDRQIEEEEEKTGLYRSVSLAPGQIPYNMQMDIDRLCLERELEKIHRFRGDAGCLYGFLLFSRDLFRKLR